MGMARWNPTEWDAYVTSTTTISARDLFGKSLHKDLDPARVAIRESRDSDLNPCSTPIIVAVDNTGSMGFLAETLIRKGLGVLIEEIYLRKPVADPQVMCMAVGDAWYDRAPLQVTQFEADLRLVEQLSRFYLEGGGGGNNFESYNLPWYFAAMKTKCDSMLKRKKKGYLFTVGDEPPPPTLLAGHAQQFLGISAERDLTSKEILAMASTSWEVFHIIIEEGSYCSSGLQKVTKEWNALLGQRAIKLSRHQDLAELIVSTIQVNEGSDLESVTATWSGRTALTIRSALKTMQRVPVSSGKGVTRL
jgi:hypothetical protein